MIIKYAVFIAVLLGVYSCQEYKISALNKEIRKLEQLKATITVNNQNCDGRITALNGEISKLMIDKDLLESELQAKSATQWQNARERESRVITKVVENSACENELNIIRAEMAASNLFTGGE